ncbi:hypothetical protein AK88_00307 [Plasmodium fragile]|uniref:Uncharacterized protein n=1 Tax=Plasmodium fragile TaxID=5857 RepID=A0A0D9QT61_PLAFR|nr:uncharacterized protein AK88_00307 [Plasmodium fragile]KJP90138.1 hypothetical protein AK88_00307 [Plasmodium fragile]
MNGRKGVFLLCTKACMYTLLFWIMNCSNTCQYGNSYSVMNNSLGTAMNSRGMRALAEAVEEDETVEQDETLEQFEQETIGEDETLEQVEQETIGEDEAAEQVTSEEDEAAEQVTSEEDEAAEQVTSEEEEVVEQVPQQAPPQASQTANVEGDNMSIPESFQNLSQQQQVLEHYKKIRGDFYRNFKPTISGDIEDLKKTVRLLRTRELALQGDEEALHSYPPGYFDPHIALQKALQASMIKQHQYRQMLANYFADVPLIDDFETNRDPNAPYYERRYGRLSLKPGPTGKICSIKQEEVRGKKDIGKGKDKKKKKRRRFWCCA